MGINTLNNLNKAFVIALSMLMMLVYVFEIKFKFVRK